MRPLKTLLTMAPLLLCSLLGLMPLAIMTSQALPSPIFYLVLALSTWIIVRPGPAGAFFKLANYKALITCLSAPLLAVLLSTLWHGKLPGNDFEIALRFLLGPTLLLAALAYIPLRTSWHTFYGYLLAAFIASIYIFYLAGPDLERPETSAVYNAVGYGNLTALLAAFCFFSLRITLTSWPRVEQLLKILLGTLALAALVITQTRSAWVAMPAFLVVGAVLFTRQWQPRRLLLFTIVGTLALGTLYVSNDTLRERAALAYTEVSSCQGESSTTYNSQCIRLQMWRAAIDMFKENPVAGLGGRRLFGPTMVSDSLPKGLVAESVAYSWGEPHNDLLLTLAALGLPGGIALLLVYLAPAWVFTRRMAFSYPTHIRTAAALGLVLCLGFLFFGLTETMFRGMRTVSFYGLSLALFLSLSDPLRQDTIR